MASSRTRQDLVKELEEMNTLLKSFRVPDLQIVLSFAQCSRAGRKAELLKRVNNLIQERFPYITNKIREIYNTLNFRSDIPITRDISNINLHDSEIPRSDLNSNKEQQHVKKSPAIDHNEPQTFPVILKKLPFYDCVTMIIPPQQLNQHSCARRSQTMSFLLTSELLSTIQSDAASERKLEVQLRFCIFDPSHEQDDCFPLNIKVTVNGKICLLPPLIKTADTLKRASIPINIMKYILLSSTLINYITVSWCNTVLTHQYMFILNLVKKLSTEELLNNFKIIPPDVTKALIKEKLKEDLDSEIATTMLRVSLICPLGRIRMITPARASTCSHLQCFDASLYLQMNEKKAKWICPVCQKEALCPNLVIDGYFQQILASTNLSTNVNEIELLPDGSWSSNLQKGSLEKHKATQDQIQINVDEYKIKLDLNHNNITKNNNNITKNNNNITKNNNNNNNNNNISNGAFVDLTISDSEDEVTVNLENKMSKRIKETNHTNKYYLRKKRANEQVTSKVKKRMKRT